MSLAKPKPNLLAVLDRGALPSAMELDTELGLETFNELERAFQAQFEATRPLRAEDLVDADGVCATLEAGNDSQGPDLLPFPLVPPAHGDAQAAVTAAVRPSAYIGADLGRALAWAQQGGRTSLAPTRWHALCTLLSACVGEHPDVPTARDLHEGGPVQQRIATRRLLRWAHEHQVLQEAVAFLHAQRAEHWLTLAKTQEGTRRPS